MKHKKTSAALYDDSPLQRVSMSDNTAFERVGEGLDSSGVSASGNGFVKIGGALPDASDPRTIKRSNGGTAGVGNRVFYLRLIDSRKWHYSETLALFLDFFVQVLSISFTPKAYFWQEVGAKTSRTFSSGLMVCYFIDVVIRVLGLRSALFRSHSNIADLLCWLGSVALLGCRYVMDKKEYRFTLYYLVVIAMRLILKPRARTFSKKLHKFRANGDHIRISIESVRASLARIPGITALAIEMMETDLVIICGRDSGDMSRDELMSFLERALQYRPHNLSATDFLAHLRDIDASSSQMAYGTIDVVRSTLSHWSNQMVDLLLCFLVVCMNASISPAMAYFLSTLSDAFYTLKGPAAGDLDLLREGILGMLGLCIPFVMGNYAIGYFQSKMISKAAERMQNNMLSIILRQGTDFFAERSEAIFLSSGPQGFAAQRSKEFGSKNAYVSAEFQNAVACQKVVRAYAIQEPLMVRFRKTCASLRKNQFSKDFWSSVVQIYIESAMYIFTAIMTASLALKVWRYEDNIRPGDFFGFITLLQRVSNPVTILGGFMRVAIGNASSLQRIDDVIFGLGSNGDDNDEDKNLPDLPKMEKDLRVEKLVFNYAVGYLQSRIISKAVKQMQITVLNTILHQDTTFFATRSEGDLNNLFSSDIARVSWLWQSVFWNLLNPLVSIVVGFGYAMYISPSIGIMAFSTAAVVLTSGPQGYAAQRSKAFGSKNAYVSAEFQNAIACQKVVRAYNIQGPLLARFATSCAELRDNQFSKDFWSGVVQIYIECAMYVFTAIITASLALKVWRSEDGINAGDFFGFVTLLQRVSHPITILGGFMRVAIGNASSLQRIDDVIFGLRSNGNDNDEDKNLPDLPKMEKDLRVEKLVFKYDKASENYILNELSCTIPRGAYTCIVGPSGCGKSRYDELVRKNGLFYEMVHKVDTDDSEDPEVSMVKKPGGSRHHSIVDTIGGGMDDPIRGMESALALQQFTKKLNSRVTHDTIESGRSGSNASWYRYGNRNSRNSRKHSNGTEEHGGRRSQNISLMESQQWYPENPQGRRAAASTASEASQDERNKYFVL
ncbi:hypothetical protein P43SY_008596 [Pythium insidiosum]|uniref:ABC transmembrane type-1 domain-containing protein n=1 Tax=Pythium insidiosum TaxID=114742 RepID=A0AAD5LE13_PYTIN|nr:hypothetical protein P43SY_008596 [Pythium insidiosum]